MLIIETLQKSNVQKRQSQTTIIKCGNEYLNETIGLSLTDDYLYQFLFVNNTLQIIRYDYQKLIRNNSNNKNDYKLNLIDGQLMSNGLNDLIPGNMVESIMSIIQWIDNESKINNNDEKPIISISMSINKINGMIHIYCLKSYDQLIYIIGDYNQEIDSNRMHTFYIKYNKMQHIMGTISDRQNEGIITFFYNKLSYYFQMKKLSSKHYGSTNFEWTKSLIIDSNSDYLFQSNNNNIDDDDDNDYFDNEKELLFKKSFQKIFDTNNSLFTYGFIDNNQLYLFTNLNEKILTFSMNIIENQFKKYSLQSKLYEEFFNCQRKNETHHHSDNDNFSNNDDDEFDDFFTVERLSTITSKSITTSDIDNIIHHNPNNNNNNNNQKNDTKNFTKNFFNPSLIRLLFIMIALTIFGPLTIITMIVCFRNCKYYYFHKEMVKKIELQKSNRSYPIYPQYFFTKRLKKMPKKYNHYFYQRPQQFNVPRRLQYQPITITTTTTTTTMS